MQQKYEFIKKNQRFGYKGQTVDSDEKLNKLPQSFLSHLEGNKVIRKLQTQNEVKPKSKNDGRKTRSSKN